MFLYTLAPVWITLLVHSRVMATKLGPCHVDCHHYGSELGNMADDPFHCNMFYVCFNWYEWSYLPLNCPEGQMFDTITKKCMKEGYTCSPPCQKCSYDCDNPIMGYVSQYSNCSMYLDCKEAILASCPPDKPYFDGNICQNDYKKCCSCKPQCSVYDADKHVMVPDYSNCTNFYLCMVPGIPDETSHGHCPSGSNFDQHLGLCSSDASCTQTCTNEPPHNGCVSEFICNQVGYFPRCTEICDPVYFVCSEDDLGYEGHPKNCSNNFVLDPIAVICIPPEDCSV